MATNFRELEEKMPPERRARIEAMARETMAEMQPRKIREQTDHTRAELVDDNECRK
jgi:hypothetical protein